MRAEIGFIEFRHLRCFLAASECGRFRKASGALGVRESAISRDVRGVSLTLAGQRFLLGARKAIRQIEDGARAVADAGRGETGHVKIGLYSSIASGFLFDLLRAYKGVYPSICVELIEGDSCDHVSAVRQLQLDIAFITGTMQWQDCESEQLWTERVLAVMPADHPLTQIAEIDWGDMAEHSFMVTDAAPRPEICAHLVQRLAHFAHRPEIVSQCVSRDRLLLFVPIERRLTLASEAATATLITGVAFRPIANEVLPFCATGSRKNDNPASRRLLRLARSMASAAKARSAQKIENATAAEPRKTDDRTDTMLHEAA
ncbi:MULTISPECIES: LysR substrate-binding domain-containing protein [Aminobacter]|uniref:Transcriptional regulator, LysR family n=1 Tax=Aminobacter aminovorans TaxID=83263 RepID=A0AAC8YSY3_AMIAI|nr:MULTISPECIES: LysR family transcriptional regulator [Aminobacter]AMS43908.1 Transcriptional regulator, LysR family [Aminobacter aminovorans]